VQRAEAGLTDIMVKRGSGLPRGTKRIRFRSAAPTVSSTSRQKREEVAEIAHPLRTPEVA